MYLLIGDHKARLVDTGDTSEAEVLPLYQQVQTLLKQGSNSHKPLIVIHSHSHQDHYGADQQFAGQPKVTVIGTTAKEGQNHFGFAKSSQGYFSLELGQRELLIMPAARHQEGSIAIYDPQNQWLLTGDTLYPGNIYVKDWQAYVKTIGPLTEFVQSHRVKWLLGAHIEMDRLTHTLYPIGTEDLLELNNRLNQTQQAQQIVTQNWIVTPIGLAQRTLSKVARWIMQW